MKKAIVILSLLVCLSHCFNVCSPIDFVDYQFDISTFSKETFGLASNTGQSGFATYFSCNLGACSDTGFNSTSSVMTSQKTYFVMVHNGQCFPLTSTLTLTQSAEASKTTICTSTRPSPAKDYQLILRPTSMLWSETPPTLKLCIGQFSMWSAQRQKVGAVSTFNLDPITALTTE